MLLSVVVPAYNEIDVLPEFHTRLLSALDHAGCDIEVIYVNDGSRDGTLEWLRGKALEDHRVGLLNFSRNFGKEAAMTAGLDHARGDAVVVIDADLQDPPELIPKMISMWEAGGVDVVYAQRRARAGESWLKRLTAWGFYSVLLRLSTVEIPRNTGDFRLMSRQVVDELLLLRETRRFMKGLFAWVGFRCEVIVYDRDARYAGTTKWRYWKLWNFALEGITSFTTAPLRLATYVGLFFATVSGAYAAYIVIRTMLFGTEVLGYPSLFAAVLFFGGTQLFFLGVLGEYIGRIFDEAKRRPLYIVREWLRPGTGPEEC